MSDGYWAIASPRSTLGKSDRALSVFCPSKQARLLMINNLSTVCTSPQLFGNPLCTQVTLSNSYVRFNFTKHFCIDLQSAS